MNRTSLQKSFGLFLFLLISLLSISFPAFGAVSSLNGVSTRADSMQAFTAVADDPSTIYYNPAGLTQIPGTSVEADLIMVYAKNEYTNSSNNVTSTSHQVDGGPPLFFSTDKLKPFTLGLGIYVPNARATDYRVNGALNNLSHHAKIKRTDVVPTIAIALSPSVSLGLSAVASRVTYYSDILGLNERGQGYGFTGQAGLLFKLPKNMKLGITYRGPENVRTYGKGTGLGITDSFDSAVNFPDVVSLGFSVPVTSSLLLAADYDYFMWSNFKEFKRNYSSPTLNAIATSTINAENVGIFRIGGIYRLENNEFRLGYAHPMSAVPSVNLIPATPDYNVNVYTIGYSRYMTKQLRLDMGYELDKALVTTSNSPLFPGDYTGTFHNFMLGVRYDFLG